MAASPRQKRLILLCSEDLRPVACALEGALRSRGWQVDVEFGADARPWVQRVPPVRPSVRVLCVPGTVDRVLAEQLRTAFRPEPDADLHILGVDDSPGLVQEIERLAGVRTPSRRPLTAAPRLAHPTLVETQVRRARSFGVSVAAAAAAFALTLGGLSMVEHSARAERSGAGLVASLADVTTPHPADLDAESSRFHDPVLAAVGPAPLEPLDEPLADDDEVIVLLDDEALDDEPLPPAEPRALAASMGSGGMTVLATPLAGASAITGDVTTSITDGITPPVTAVITDGITPPVTAVITTRSLPALPPGFLPVAGLPLSETAPKKRHLPKGFLPVAGMTAAPPVTTVDPFATTDGTTAAAVATIDPFGAELDTGAP